MNLEIHGFRIFQFPCFRIRSLLSDSSSSGSYQLLLIFITLLADCFALCLWSEHDFFEFCDFLNFAKLKVSSESVCLIFSVAKFLDFACFCFE